MVMVSGRSTKHSFYETIYEAITGTERGIKAISGCEGNSGPDPDSRRGINHYVSCASEGNGTDSSTDLETMRTSTWGAGATWRPWATPAAPRRRYLRLSGT